jgi:predicted metal-dependent HD superfamily phosphohydrolase/catechol 2,3-dioxygenase-like lactoylglutathione lyase family enzyme
MPDLARFWPLDDDELRRRLVEAYDAPGRGYHDLLHLTEVLEHVDDLLPHEDPARTAVVLAAWFHDAVYEGRADDEERSARLAETSLDGSLASEVGRLVRVTAAHRPADDDVAGQVLCDADLAILAAPAERYASYVAGVRTEHAHVTDADFAAGRAAVLQDLLDKPTLFHTGPARRRWEDAARANVQRELSRLRGRPRPVFRSPQVVLFSEDLHRAAEFYTGLGFTEVFRTPTEGEPIHVDLVLDGYRIGLASVASTRDDHGLDPVPSGQRAAVVLWTDDVRAAYDDLTARGAPALAEPHEWLGRLLIAWTADPDGNPVQVVQPLP